MKMVIQVIMITVPLARRAVRAVEMAGRYSVGVRTQRQDS